MRRGGLIGLAILIVLIGSALYVWNYTLQLEESRQNTIDGLATIVHQECKYDDPILCPQVEGNVQLPNPLAIILLALGVLLGGYLLRSDMTQRKILVELGENRKRMSSNEKRDIIFSVLTAEEKTILQAVIAQPGISQATLRLRVDMSKAKLSGLLKNLESRELIVKETHGKTNVINLKKGL